MAYADFTLESAEAAFGITSRLVALFPDLAPSEVPAWLTETLARGRNLFALISEKARSEVLVAPILAAATEGVAGQVAIFSGQRLDVDPARGLVGECDFILARTTPLPRLKAPVLMVLEAKKGDVEAGLGQCLAQVVAARIFNDRAGEPPRPMYGCVTSAQVWQFFRVDGPEVLFDRSPLYLDNLGVILAALRVAIEPPR